LDQLLNAVGFADYLDYLWIYVNIPLNAIGVIFNLLALIVLQDGEFTMRLFGYMRVHCATSSFNNLISLLTFTANTPFTFSWSNTYPAYVFFLFMSAPITNICYLYGTTLDILILLDRIGMFKPNMSKWIKLSAYKTSLVAFICCVAIEIPYFFEYVPYALTANLNATFVQTIWYGGPSAFALSQVGTIITFITYAIRDIISTSVIILLNIASVYLLKEYMSRKAKLLNKTKTLGTVATNVISVGANQAGNIERTQNNVQRANKQDVSKSDLKLGVMVVIMCILTIVEHLCQIVTVVYPYVGTNAITFHIVYYLNYTVLSVKNAAHFFLFFIFNVKFRSVALKLVKRES
jgi:hypothetical protein